MSSKEYLVGYVQYSGMDLIADILRCLYFECKSIPVVTGYLDQLKTEEAKARTKVLTDEEIISISKLIKNVKENLQFIHNMTLVFIIDQTNNLLKEPNKFKQMINFIKNNLFPGHIVILSGSANNEVDNFPGVLPQMFRLPFSEEELKAFIVMNRPQNEHNAWCDEQIVSQILGITGSVAIEINRFVNGFFNGIEQIQASLTLSKRFREYEKLYGDQYHIANLRSWYNKRKEEGNGDAALENIERFDLLSIFSIFSRE